MTTAYRTRADRIELERRLQAARHAGELLHNKEEALARERVARQGHATRAARRWEDACDLADLAIARARLLGASGELARLVAAQSAIASVSIDWRHSMGLTIPGEATFEPGAAPVVVSTTALGPAIEAVRAAVEAAVGAAATAEAVRRLDHEVAATRRRRRAVEERLVPRLEVDSHELDLRLDERERDEALRVRLAADAARAEAGRGGGT